MFELFLQEMESGCAKKRVVKAGFRLLIFKWVSLSVDELGVKLVIRYIIRLLYRKIFLFLHLKIINPGRVPTNF